MYIHIWRGYDGGQSDNVARFFPCGDASILQDEKMLHNSKNSASVPACKVNVIQLIRHYSKVTFNCLS
jgi:hypothetical protein